MQINISESDGFHFATIEPGSEVISSPGDALDLIANCGYRGSNRIILHESNLAPAFFDLKTKLAGEILQKFSNYRSRLAIIGDFSKYGSKSLRDFIYESNKHGLVNFVATMEEAEAALSKR